MRPPTTVGLTARHQYYTMPLAQATGSAQTYACYRLIANGTLVRAMGDSATSFPAAMHFR